MAATFTVRSGDTDPIYLPLTVDEVPMDLTGVSGATVYVAGWLGKLPRQAAGTAAVSTVVTGSVLWTMPTGGTALSPLYSPYTLYVTLTMTSGGALLSVPREEFFRLEIVENT